MSGPSEVRLVAASATSSEIARMGGWVRAVAARAAQLAPPAESHLVVTPLGMPERAWLWRTLCELGVTPVGRRALPEWPALSSALYVTRLDPEALRRAILFEHAWNARYPDAPAEAWALARGAHARVHAVKHAVRAGMPHVRVVIGGVARVLHPFHLADPRDAEREGRSLAAAEALLLERRGAPAGPSALRIGRPAFGAGRRAS